MGPGSRVLACRRLTGGVSSAVHRVSLDREGRRSEAVLRQYPGGLGLAEVLRQEIDTLARVADHGLPVPEVLAADPEGEATSGCPSLLTTLLSGEIVVDPAEPRAGLTAIAELAARVHALDVPALAFRPWTDSWIAPPAELRVPSCARDPAVWEAAFAVMADPPPADRAVVLHGDLLPVNLLWSGGRITGLLDWTSLRRGPTAVDLGQCRRYLAALGFPDRAEDLRTEYEAVTGMRLDPWWDLYALLHHDEDQPRWIRRQVAGRLAVDEEGMTARVEVAVRRALLRLG